MEIKNGLKLFILFYKNQKKYGKTRSFLIFLLILIIPQLSFFYFQNNTDIIKFSQNPAYFSINDSSILNSNNFNSTKNFSFGSNIDYFNKSSIEFIQQSNSLISDFYNTVENKSISLLGSLNSIFFSKSELANFIFLLNSSNIIEIEGTLPENENEILLDKHFCSFLNRTIHQNYKINDLLNFSIKSNENIFGNRCFFITGFFSIRDYSLMNQILTYHSNYLKVDIDNRTFYTDGILNNIFDSNSFLYIGNIETGKKIQNNIITDLHNINYFVYRKLIFNPFWIQRFNQNYNFFPINENQMENLIDKNEFENELYSFNSQNNFYFYLDFKPGINNIIDQLNSNGEIKIVISLLDVLIIIIFIIYTYVKLKSEQDFYESEWEYSQSLGFSKKNIIFIQIIREVMALLKAGIYIVLLLLGIFEFYLNFVNNYNIIQKNIFNLFYDSMFLFIFFILFMIYSIIFLLYMNKNFLNDKILESKNNDIVIIEKTNKKFSNKFKISSLFILICLFIIPLLLPLNYDDNNTLFTKIFSFFDSILFMKPFTLIETFLFQFYQDFFFIIILIFPFILIYKFSPKILLYINILYKKLVLKRSKLSKVILGITISKNHHFNLLFFISIISLSYSIGIFNVAQIYESNELNKEKETFGCDILASEYTYTREESMNSQFGLLKSEIKLLKGINNVMFCSNSYFFIDKFPIFPEYDNWRYLTFFDPLTYYFMYQNDTMIISNKCKNNSDFFNLLNENPSNIMIGRKMANKFGISIGSIINMSTLNVIFEGSKVSSIDCNNISLTVVGIWDYLPGIELYPNIFSLNSENSYSFISWNFLYFILNYSNLDSKIKDDFYNPKIKKYYIQVEKSYKELKSLSLLKSQIMEKFSDRIESIELNPYYSQNQDFIYYAIKIFCVYLVFLMCLFLLSYKSFEYKSRTSDYNLLIQNGYKKNKIKRLFNMEFDLQVFSIYFVSGLIGFLLSYMEFKLIYYFNFWGYDYNPLKQTQQTWDVYFPIEFNPSLISFLIWIILGFFISIHFFHNLIKNYLERLK